MAVITEGPNEVQVTLHSTPEFGPVGDYWVTIYVDGERRIAIPPTGSAALSTTFVVQNLVLTPADSFVNIIVASADKAHAAIANPIWLELEAAADD